MLHFFCKYSPLYFTMFALPFIYSYIDKRQSASLDSLIVGKWKMVEYGSGYVNALGTHCFYKDGKVDCPPETGEFTYRFIKSDSLIIYKIRALENSISRYSNYPMTAL